MPIYLNPFKPNYQTQDLEKIQWTENGYFLKSEINFSTDPLLYAGAYAVINAPNMILEQIIKQIQAKFTRPTKVLDVFATYGANSSVLVSNISPETLLVANESNKNKIQQLKENIARWGVNNVIVSSNHLAEISKIEGYFDVIFVSLTKEIEISNEQIFENVEAALNPGGFLIITNDSSEFPIELHDLANKNELQQFEIHLDNSWGGDLNQNELFVSYSKDVFSFACYSKPQDDLARGGGLRKTKIDYFHNKNRPFIENWLHESDSYDLIQIKEEVIAIPKSIIDDYALLNRYLTIQKVGVKLGKLMNGKSLVPDFELALINKPHIEVSHIDVDEKSAGLFLKRQDFEILENYPSGWQIVKYQNYALGWVKVIGKRMNNYYPKEIKMIKEF